ncbi:flocculation protein FLO11 isoform X1 [Lathyrus oleraceus]|uniref:flocculation protein FLO11 isoform X1 n=1 Tax=Pisum sativum TaxID=3888 RepID=UPI0021D3813E|nr:flocculation protein FLO11-like isoform X1 [Pisum sativum]
MNSDSDSSLRNNDVNDRRLSIIDFLSADDSLLDPVSSNHQNSENEAWYTPNSNKFEDAATKIEQWEDEPQTSEKKTMRNPKCNLRKSLAWDSAFFTSAGVLDPDELSSIIEGVEKENLPRIEEDVYKSCDSVSTLGSDSLTFESVDLEGDLFEDVRASIQKSSRKSNLATAPTRMSSASGLPGLQTPSRKVSVVTRNKIKAPPTPRNPTTPVVRGIGKATNKNTFTQISQPLAARRESSISKLSKLPAKPIASSTISAKRASLSGLHAKGEKDRAKHIIDRVISMSKASVIGGSRGTEPKPTILSKSTSGQSVSTKAKSVSSTSSGSNLSANIAKSPFNSARRKVIAGNSKPPSSRPPVRTPSGFASRNKIESVNSSLSSLISANKLSSSISPASSVSDWSSEASITASVPKHMCDSSRSSIDSCSSSYSQILHSDLSLEGREAQRSGIISPTARTASVAAVIPSALAKPSGLRLPSPKIGFFDGVKSSVRTPRGGAQPHSSAVLQGLLNHGARSPSEGQNKAKLGNLQAVRSITPIGNKKVDNQKNPHPSHFDESLDIAIKAGSAEQNIKTSTEMLKGALKNVEYTSLSHEIENTNHDLRTLTRVNHQENVYPDNQIDCLIKQVGLMDINSTTQQKINGNSLSFCETDVSFQDKSNGMELSKHREFFNHPKNQELLKGSSTPGLCVAPTSVDLATSARRPFSAKDSFFNMDYPVFTEPSISEVKLTNILDSESRITKDGI